MRDWPRHPASGHHRAVFLDRDGTINVDTHYPHRVEDLRFIDGALDALARLSRLSLDIIVVSNQAGIALGLFGHEDTCSFNDALRARVEAAGARIDAFYYSPDLEPKNLREGDRPSPFSKPAPGMLLEAQRDFQLDLRSSYIVGDKLSDVEAGKMVGCTAILVRTGKSGADGSKRGIEPDVSLADLLEAAEWIADQERRQRLDRRLPTRVA